MRCCFCASCSLYAHLAVVQSAPPQCTTIQPRMSTALESSTQHTDAATTRAEASRPPPPPPSQRVTLIRPGVWLGGVHPCYSVSVQPGVVGGRQRVATASADKVHGVCIWDLGEVTAATDEAVKLEDSAQARTPRGLLTILPHHLSAVNVVRWEPVLGARLASGSDLPTQSIIVWKREENRADASSDSAAAKGSSSAPFGLARSSSNPRTGTSGAPSASSADSPSDAFPTVEHWAPLLSLHGQTDITDLAWGPPGLHFIAVSSEDDFGFGAGGNGGNQAPVGCTMDPPAAVAARLARGLGSQVLASCSLDRSVIVWNTDTGDRHSLKGHTGWVLGVSFDPTGSFLATQTIDGFVWVWSLATFQLQRKIRDVGLTLPKSIGDGSGPRTDVGRTVSFARISWTPDGAALVACRGEVKRSAWGSSASSAKKRSTIKHVSVALNRKRNFETQAVFGGHAGRTTVSAFNPVLFLADSSDSSSAPTAEKRFFSVLAVGSHDCTLSLWSTRRPTPLLLLTEIWTDSILDLSWTADGRTLVVSAHDGSIVVLQFEEGVFGGRAATEEESAERMRSLFGGAAVEGSALTASGGVLASTHGLYDSPALLEMQAQQKLAHQRLKEAAEKEHKAHAAEREERKHASPPALVSSSAPAATASLNPEASTLSLQTVVRRADGKRRIIPVHVPAPAVESLSFISSTAARSTSTSATAAAAATGSSAASHLAHATPAMLMALTAGAIEMEDAAVASAPQPLNAADDLFGELDAGKPKKRKRVEEESTEVSAAAAKSAKPSDAASSGAAAAAATPAAAAARPPSDEFLLPAPVRPMRWALPVPVSSAASFAPPRGTAVSLWELQVTDYSGKPLAGSGTPAASALLPTSQATIISAFASAAASAAADAAAAGSSSSSARQLAWQSFVPQRVLLSAGNSAMLVLACADTASGQFYLHCLSTSSGRQLHPPLLLSAPPFLLSMHAKDRLGSLLIITCDGLVRVYDLSAASPAPAKRLRIQASLRTMLRSSAVDSRPAAAGAKKKSAAVKEEPLSIIAARLSEDDTPVVVLSNHHAFRYDVAFESWSLVASATPSFPGSEMRSELSLFQRTAVQQQHKDEVSTLAAAATPAAPSTAVPLAVLNSMDARTRVLHTLAHLESELTLRTVMGDAAAYRLAVTTYVAKLVSLYPAVPAALLKLTELCRELKGPASASASFPQASLAAAPPRWQPFVWVSRREHTAALATPTPKAMLIFRVVLLCVRRVSPSAPC